MIPTTLAAIIGFLGLVVFELLREHRRHTSQESAYREASRVALMSLVFTLMACGAPTVVAALEPRWVPSVGSWLTCGSAYTKENYALILRMTALEVGKDCALAYLADFLLTSLAPGRSNISKTRVWFQALRADVPKNFAPWVHAKLSEGTEIWG
jgi:hypothetical protein